MKSAISRLEMLIPFADAVAQTIGPNCEVAIHDLSHPQHSIFYIVNGAVTGRRQGDSLDPLFSEVIRLAAQNGDALTNYYTTENGHALRCTKVLIRDEAGRIIGCFCINISIDEFLQMKQTVDALCRTRPLSDFRPAGAEPEETDSVQELMERMIAGTYDDLRGGRTRLTREERLKMTRFLDEKGIFRIRGSVETMAQTLGVSKFTIYSDIDKLKNSEGLLPGSLKPEETP